MYDGKSGVYRCVDKYRGRQLDAAGLKKQLKIFLMVSGVHSPRQTTLNNITGCAQHRCASAADQRTSRTIVQTATSEFSFIVITNKTHKSRR